MQQHHQQGNRFSGSIERLRAPERVARLEVAYVLKLAQEGIQAGVVSFCNGRATRIADV